VEIDEFRMGNKYAKHNVARISKMYDPDFCKKHKPLKS